MSIKDRGFGSLSKARQRVIAQQGGRAAHEAGTGHEWTTQTAREAGRKGGLASAKARAQKKAQRAR